MSNIKLFYLKIKLKFSWIVPHLMALYKYILYQSPVNNVSNLVCKKLYLTHYISLKSTTSFLYFVT